MGGFSWQWVIFRGSLFSEIKVWRVRSPPPCCMSAGVVRMSISAQARSGTMFGRVPPLMVPMLRVLDPRMGWVKSASWGLSRASISTNALARRVMAFSPRWGWEEWAAFPVAVTVSHAEPLVTLTRSSDVGSPAMAKM